jgi:site-specific recombinase XerD
MSGIGKIFRRRWQHPDGTWVESAYWSIRFPFAGDSRVEATKCTTEADARKVLKQRIQEIARGTFVPNQEKVYLLELVDLLKAHYLHNNLRALRDALYKTRSLLEFFDGVRVPTIAAKEINAFVKWRLDQGKTTATVNGDLRCLRVLFHLGAQQKVISKAIVPEIQLLKGENKRDGFINPADFGSLLSKFDNGDVADLVEFLYWTGWRVAAGRGLLWANVNLENKIVKMTAILSKNKQPLELPLNDRLEAILMRRKEKRRLECPFVFHRRGRKIVNFNADWKEATEAAGFKGLLVHDMCRSFARNLSHTGENDSVVGKYMNRKDLNIVKQYRIVDSEDLRRAGQALDNLGQGEKKVEKINE